MVVLQRCRVKVHLVLCCRVDAFDATMQAVAMNVVLMIVLVLG